MSERADETNADRIQTIQESLPPDPSVRSRTGHASIDRLAALVGTNRSHIIQWKKGTEPLRRHRERLAELSGGRYTPDDFRVHPQRQQGSGDLTLAGLAAVLVGLEETVEELSAIAESNATRIGRLEQQLELVARRPARGGRGR